MHLNQRIEEERNRVSKEIKKLTEENQVDLSLLNDLKQEYNTVVVNSDEIEIDKVNAQIKEVNGRINRRKEKISAYSDKHNPVIQKMISEEVKGWLNEVAILEEQANEKVKMLKPTQQKLMNELLELNNMKNRSHNLRHWINVYSEQLNDVSRKNLSLPKYFDVTSSIVNQMRSLLIGEGQVFKL